jgi:hypothetical protein
LKGALMMGKNVMIPMFLLDQIIELLQHWDISDYCPELRYDYDNIVWALAVKKQKIKLRDAYAKLIQPDNPQAWDEAFTRYLQQKCLLEETEENIPF